MIGQNGADESTRLKLLTGVYRRGAGRVQFGGEEATFTSPLQAQRADITTIGHVTEHLSSKLTTVL